MSNAASDEDTLRCIAWSLCVILPGTVGHPPPLVLIVSFARFIAPPPHCPSARVHVRPKSSKSWWLCEEIYLLAAGGIWGAGMEWD